MVSMVTCASRGGESVGFWSSSGSIWDSEESEEIYCMIRILGGLSLQPPRSCIVSYAKKSLHFSPNSSPPPSPFLPTPRSHRNKQKRKPWPFLLSLFKKMQFHSFNAITPAFQDCSWRAQIFLKGNCLFQTTMSLASIWSGNFYHLRNTLTSSNSLKLLRLGTYGTSQTMLDTGRSNARSFTTKVEARNRKPQSNQSYGVKLELLDGTVIRRTKPKAKKLQLQEFKIIKYCDIQPKITDGKVSGKVVAVLVFDIETTGFCKNRDRIIEVAIQDLRGGKNSTFQTLVNPERYVPNAHIHGISSHMVNKPDIPRWKDLAPILLHFVRSRQIDGGPVLLVAHNGRCFDVPFIIKEFGRCSIEIPPDWLYLDTVPLARQLVKPDGTKLSSWNLQALREHYGIPLAGTAHRAMSDVNMLSLILQKMTFDLKLTVSSLLDRSFMVSTGS